MATDTAPSTTAYHCDSCGPVPGFCGLHRCEARPVAEPRTNVAVIPNEPTRLRVRVPADFNAGLEAAARVALKVFEANSSECAIYEDQIRAQIAIEISKRIVALKMPIHAG